MRNDDSGRLFRSVIYREPVVAMGEEVPERMEETACDERELVTAGSGSAG